MNGPSEFTVTGTLKGPVRALAADVRLSFHDGILQDALPPPGRYFPAALNWLA